MRLFDPNVVNALEADELRIFYLLEFTIDSITYRYTDSDIPLIVNGERFEPKSFRLQNISYSTKKIVDQTTLELDNLDQVLTSSFVGGTPQGSEVKISLAILNSGVTTILSSDSYYWNFTNGSLEALSGTEPESGYVVTTRENEGPNGSDAIAVEMSTTNLLKNSGATDLDTAIDFTGYSTKTDLGNGKYKFVNDGSGNSAIRLYCNSSDLTDGDSYTTSVYYEGLTSWLSIDWCDVAFSSHVTDNSGRLIFTGARTFHNSTYRFVDINLGSGGEVTLYKAQIEHCSTNPTLTNASFETGDFTGWTHKCITSAATYTIDSSERASGSYSFKSVQNGTTDLSCLTQNFTAEEYTTYKLSVWFKAETGNYGYINLYDVTHNTSHSIAKEGNGYWQELTIETTFPAGTDTGRIYLYSIANNVTTNTVYYDEIRLEKINRKRYGTSYTTGTRSTGRLQYNGVLGETSGTISFWANIQDSDLEDNYHFLISTEGTYNAVGAFAVILGTANGSDNTQVRIYDTSGAGHVKTFNLSDFSIRTWQHWCVIYNESKNLLDLYIDGELVTNGNQTTWTDISVIPNICLGCYGNFIEQYNSNVLIDNLLILDYDITEGEIAALANENAMPAITIFEGNLGNWWLDEEKISFTVTNQFSQWNQTTLNRHSPSCRWKKFKGTECGYDGSETWCNRTYTRCQALDNTANFGGYRWLPSIVDKNVWWGQIPKS